MRTARLLAAVAALALLASGCNAITRLSVSSSGGQFSRQSGQPSVSDDGGIVAFVSYQSLDPADTDNDLDVFVREVGPELTYRISSGPAGEDVGDLLASGVRQYIAEHALYRGPAAPPSA